MKKIGTVEILRERIYPLDPDNRSGTATTAVVPPGTYDVFSDGLSYCWLMEGQLNDGGPWKRLGDGLFSSGNDKAGPLTVRFPSKTFGEDEWTEFLLEIAGTEGTPNERLRFHILEEAQS